MLYHGAQAGAFDLKTVLLETLTGMRRAGKLVSLTSVVWNYHTFENNFGIKHTVEKYLKESCRLNTDEQLSFKYFLNIAFVREISPK